MIFIGITGGVGAGKSEILNYLKSKENIRVMLADEIAHDLMEPKQEAYLKICETFAKEDIFLYDFETIAFAHPGKASKEIKYPPLGGIQLPISRPPSSFSKVSSTASNFGRMSCAWRCMCALSPLISLKNLACRNWLILS